ncbi:MAG: hypothetical protein K1X92_10975 [Bacteroidia bacterium]|nr:hypothetical protein [Bacteroidia bacterium]
MRRIQIVLFSALFLALASSFIPSGMPLRNEPVNPVIGDAGYIHYYGEKPSGSADEFQRVQSHLRYAEELLRNKDISHLSPSQKEKRLNMLDLLNEYWNRGAFPVNYDRAERRPCFIDKDNVICAVGYLIQQTKGQAVAEEINRDFKYSRIMEMNTPVIGKWANEFGFTMEELATIQPQYISPNPPSYIHPAYGAWSGILGGFNIGVNTINLTNISRSRGNSVLPIVGIFSGLGSVTMGSVKLASDDGGFNQNTAGENSLAFANIGLGTLTTTLSIYALCTNRKKDRRTSFHLYQPPSGNNVLAMGMGIRHRF